MFPTSNSRARGQAHHPARACIAALVLAALVAPGQTAPPADPGPNAPLPARKKEREVPRALSTEQFSQPVELKGFEVRHMEKARDVTVLHLAGTRFLKTARDPIQIQVTLKQPLKQSARDSAPLMVLNGVRLTGTRVLPDHRNTLVAFLPDTSALKEDNTLTVIWVGNEDLIRTKEPFKFKSKDIK